MNEVAHEAMQRTARLAGALYLVLLPLGFFSFVYVPSVVVVRDDAAATARNLLASESLVRGGAISHLATQVIVVFLALAFYRLFRPVDSGQASLMTILALLGIPLSFAAEVDHLGVFEVLRGAGSEAFVPAQLQAQAMLLLERYRSGIFVAQIFWGLWLLPLGVLVYRSGFLPRFLGLAVVVGAAGYLVDSTSHLLALDLPILSRFTFLGEILLPLWLVVRGIDTERWPRAGFG